MSTCLKDVWNRKEPPKGEKSLQQDMQELSTCAYKKAYWRDWIIAQKYLCCREKMEEFPSLVEKTAIRTNGWKLRPGKFKLKNGGIFYFLFSFYWRWSATGTQDQRNKSFSISWHLQFRLWLSQMQIIGFITDITARNYCPVMHRRLYQMI